MQQQLNASHPDLDIEIIGVNQIGHPLGLGGFWITEGRDLPWLEDVDENENGKSDVWEEKWEVTYRDVVILDEDNEKAGVFNLTTHNLADPDNYDTLRQMLIDTADATDKPSFEAGDSNRDFRFNQSDLVLVHQGEKYGTGEAATWEEGDWTGDGVFNQLDLIAALKTGNYLQGPYASLASYDPALAKPADSDDSLHDEFFAEMAGAS